MTLLNESEDTQSYEGEDVSPDHRNEPEQCFKELISDYYDDLLRLARSLTRGDDARSADIVHDSIERAIAAWDRFVPSEGADNRERAFRGWMIKIVRHTFINSMRATKNRREVYAEHSNDEERPSVRLQEIWDVAASDPRDEFEEDTADEVLEAVARLSPAHRVVVEKVYFEEIEVSVVAQQLGVARQTVLSRLSRARAEMKKRLGDYACEVYGLGAGA